MALLSHQRPRPRSSVVTPSYPRLCRAGLIATVLGACGAPVDLPGGDSAETHGTGGLAVSSPGTGSMPWVSGGTGGEGGSPSDAVDNGSVAAGAGSVEQPVAGTGGSGGAAPAKPTSSSGTATGTGGSLWVNAGGVAPSADDPSAGQVQG